MPKCKLCKKNEAMQSSHLCSNCLKEAGGKTRGITSYYITKPAAKKPAAKKPAAKKPAAKKPAAKKPAAKKPAAK